MASSGFVSKDQFLCCICLDVFTLPVTIPCGHNFCKACITQAWDVNVKYQCPLCKELFYRRPDLRVNTVLSEMAAQKKRIDLKEQLASEHDVPCDVCTETKLKALKSCLVCLTSYCETHLEPHHRITGLKRHTLIDPVENLEERMCKKHDRPLEMFCKTNQTYMCQLCIETDHKRYTFVPLKKEYEEKKSMLEKHAQKIQQMIQERRRKIDEMKQSVRLSKDDADKETTASVQVFIALMQSVERGLTQLVETIEEKQKTTEKRAEGFIRELEEEISELVKRSAEVEQLSHTEDHLQLLQSFPSVISAPPAKDWTEVRVHASYEGMVGRAVAQLEEMFGKELKKLLEAELERVRRFAVDVTLDPETAHAALILSHDGKEVKCGDAKKSLPDNPKRFSYSPCVLGKQSFSSGKSYYEVEVKGKTKWDLGVARESINRKGHIAASPATGLWALWLKNGNEYRALDEPGVSLSLKSRPQKVGVFVDYEGGLISFYDVDMAQHIYSFTGCNFTEKLFPFFGPCTNDGGKNSAPLIISPVTTKHLTT